MNERDKAMALLVMEASRLLSDASPSFAAMDGDWKMATLQFFWGYCTLPHLQGLQEDGSYKTVSMEMCVADFVAHVGPDMMEEYTTMGLLLSSINHSEYSRN